MQWHFVKSINNLSSADLLVVPFWKNQGSPSVACPEFTAHSSDFFPLLDLGDFSGKEKELFLTYRLESKEPRILFLGLGNEEKVSLEVLRKAYAEIVKYALQKKWKNLNVLLPTTSSLNVVEILMTILEAIGMTHYGFDYQTSQETKTQAMVKNL